MIPALNVTTLDGNLGRTLDTSKVLAMVGISSSGTAASPTYLGRVSDVISTFGAGPLVDYAAFAIQAYGIPVLACKVAQHADGTASEVTKVGTGTSTVTVTSGAKPNNAYQLYVEVITGCTIGTTGGEYQWSLDGGRTMSATTALGTSNAITFPDAGTLGLSFGVGTLVAGDTFSVTTTAPTWQASDLTTACEALGAHVTQWKLLSVVGELTDADSDALDLFVIGLYNNQERDVGWFGGARLPEAAEAEATYQAAVVAEYTTKSTLGRGTICAGSCRVTSAVDAKKYRRSPLILAAPLIASVSEEVDVADITRGALPTCSITDENGNPEDHDELLHGVLDDAGFMTLRTWSNTSGVYFNNPRTFTDYTSDFSLGPNRRVMDLALTTARAYLRKVLSKQLRVNKRTGFIKEPEAVRIEKGLTRALELELLGKPKASGVTVLLSRTDNILSTKTLTVDIQIVPLAYPKTINLTIGFYNPALMLLAA